MSDLHKSNSLLRQTAMTIIEDNGTDERIKRKLIGYRNQDKKRRVSLPLVEISCREICKLLQDSEFKCFYCGEIVSGGELLKRDPNQWTLDRIDNSKNHSISNCVIACLQCNLARRTRDSEKYKQWRCVTIRKKC